VATGCSNDYDATYGQKKDWLLIVIRLVGWQLDIIEGQLKEVTLEYCVDLPQLLVLLCYLVILIVDLIVYYYWTLETLVIDYCYYSGRVRLLWIPVCYCVAWHCVAHCIDFSGFDLATIVWLTLSWCQDHEMRVLWALWSALAEPGRPWADVTFVVKQ